MTALERAQRDAREGNTVAAVALQAMLGRATDWPAEFRAAALAEYGLSASADPLPGSDRNA